MQTRPMSLVLDLQQWPGVSDNIYLSSRKFVAGLDVSL